MIDRLVPLLLVGALAVSLAAPLPSETVAVVGYLDARGSQGWQAALHGQPLERVDAEVAGDGDRIRLEGTPPDGAGSFLLTGDGDVVAFSGEADLVVRNGDRQMTIHVSLDGERLTLARHPMDLSFDEGVHPFCPSRLERTVDGPAAWRVQHNRMIFDAHVAPGSTGLLELGTIPWLDCPEAAIGFEHLGNWTVVS